MVSLGQAGESRLKGGSSHTSSSRKRPSLCNPDPKRLSLVRL